MQIENRMTVAQAAEYLGITRHTLDVWRSAKRYAIPYTKVGRLVFYAKSDLDGWLSSRRVAA